MWQDYFAPTLLTNFAQAHACRVEISTFRTNEQLIDLLERDADGFDVVVPSSYIVPHLVSRGLLQVLDRTLLDHAGTVDPRVDALALGAHVNAAFHGIPFVVAQSGLAWRSGQPLTADSARGWRDFANAGLYGRASLLGDKRDLLAAGLLACGYGVNDVDHLDAAGVVIAEWLQIARLDDTEFPAKLLSGRYLLSQAYPGDVDHILGPTIHFAVPREGAPISVEYLCIAAESKNPDLAYEWIDALLDAGNSEINVRWSSVQYASTEALSQTRAATVPRSLTVDGMTERLVLKPLDKRGQEACDRAWAQLGLDREPPGTPR